MFSDFFDPHYVSNMIAPSIENDVAICLRLRRDILEEIGIVAYVVAPHPFFAALKGESLFLFFDFHRMFPMYFPR